MAREHLERARRALELKDYPACVGSSQLCAENAAKAVIAIYRIPSWSHDPSEELRQVIEEHQIEIESRIGEPVIRLFRLAEIAEILAPEHGRASYGEPIERRPPRAIYNEDKAINALNKADEAFKIADKAISRLTISPIS
ncbi:MAG: HEPN domain protein [Candidatus Bathyarchaeota archaeon BA1]|nr:MAG: HEPN domain protein [Candidatus Bathyarchaeota archaeon BA1]